MAKKAGTFVGDEAKNIIDFRASYARISEKMDQRMIDGLNYLNATYKYDSDALVADNTKFTISNLDASDKLVALYTNIKADRKLDKDDVFGYYKLSSIGKASNPGNRDLPALQGSSGRDRDRGLGRRRQHVLQRVCPVLSHADRRHVLRVIRSAPRPRSLRLKSPTPSAPTARAGRRMPRATGSASPASRRIRATGRIPITSRLRVSAVTSPTPTRSPASP